MKQRIFFLQLLVALCLGLWPVASGAQELPTVNELLKNIEDSLDLTADVSARVVMTQQKAEQGTKTVDMIYYRRDTDDSFLIVMVAPENEKGNGYLRVGENFWMYRVNTRIFQHINRDESIAGTDADGDDFENRKLTELYQATIDASGQAVPPVQSMLGKIPVYQFNVIAKINDVDYPKKTYWIRTDNFLPLKEQSYSLSDTLMQTAYYRKYTEINQRFVPIEMLIIDEFEKGNKTIVEIANIATDKLDDKIFTKAYLENLSK